MLAVHKLRIRLVALVLALLTSTMSAGRAWAQGLGAFPASLPAPQPRMAVTFDTGEMVTFDVRFGAVGRFPGIVYLVPVVMLIGIGNVSGVLVTVIFALAPLIRLTSLGIRTVNPSVVEAARAFGASPSQIMFKVELPMATPTIFAGLNQTIMLSLSMVVIASMISVRGLGNEVLRAMGRLDAGKAIVGGLGIVILAIVLDRITQGLNQSRRERGHRHWWQSGPVGLIANLFHKHA